MNVFVLREHLRQRTPFAYAFAKDPSFKPMLQTLQVYENKGIRPLPNESVADYLARAKHTASMSREVYSGPGRSGGNTTLESPRGGTAHENQLPPSVKQERLEAYRAEGAKRLGLPDNSTVEDVMRESNRLQKAQDLGLPRNASWEEIEEQVRIRNTVAEKVRTEELRARQEKMSAEVDRQYAEIRIRRLESIHKMFAPGISREEFDELGKQNAQEFLNRQPQTPVEQELMRRIKIVEGQYGRSLFPPEKNLTLGQLLYNIEQNPSIGAKKILQRSGDLR